MKENFKIYEKTIEKKHSISFISPKYKEEFKTSLSQVVFVPIIEEVMKQLDWEIVYIDEKTAQANREKQDLFGVDKIIAKIVIEYNHGKILVKSESIGNEIWDNGKNSKNVKLFIHAFKEIEKTFDRASLQQLEEEQIKKNNWDDYEIPVSLPKPKTPKKVNFPIVIIGSFLVAIILGFLLAKIALNFYVIILFEALIAVAISFLLTKLMKLSNFTEHKKIEYIIIGMIITIYCLNQYFQYEIILYENNLERIGFFEFLKLRLEAGLKLKSLNTGWIGLVISWILQLVITYYVALTLFASNLIKFQINRVPSEVIDFAFYHFIKEKNEKEVRQELAAKGWTNTQNQDEVMEAVAAIGDAREMSRM